MEEGLDGDPRYRGTTRAQRPERRRRPHRVKWKPVYARLSSRVNPDHSSIAPQTGDPRDLSSPSAGPDVTAPLRFLALRPGNQFQRRTFCAPRAIEIDGVTRQRESVGRPPSPARLSRSKNDATRIFSWAKMDAEKEGRRRRSGEVLVRLATIFPIPRGPGPCSFPALALFPSLSLSISPLFRSFTAPTIGSPLKLNSRSIRPQGKFCSNGSEINVSFKRSPVPRDLRQYTEIVTPPLSDCTLHQRPRFFGILVRSILSFVS